MIVDHVSIFPALGGGILIGLASFLAAASTGKIPGISGIFSRMLTGAAGDRGWRMVFLVGLIAGAAVMFALSPAAAAFGGVRSPSLIVVAGVLVGLGTRLGGGCTSGHGVCGIGLGAKDGLIATVIFMAAGMGTVFVMNHLVGGGV